MASHAEARIWAHEGFVSAMGRDPTLLEVQFLQAVALLESGYGQGWKGEGVGSWNMGAVQAGRPPCNPSTSFSYTDTHPNPDGSSTPYTICFKRYAGPVEGMADVARILYKQMGIVPNSIRAVSQGMYNHHYYEGFGKTPEDRVNNHIGALTAGLKHITDALNEPMPPAESGEPMASPFSSPVPVYYLGLSSTPGEHVLGDIHLEMRDNLLVRMLQSVLRERGLYSGNLDGDYGPLTEAAVRKFLGLA